MKKLLLRIIVTALFIINIIIMFLLITELDSMKYTISLLESTNNSENTIYRRPSIRVHIRYTALDGTKKEISTYDNNIDVGNEAINIVLTNAISNYRDMNMVCSCYSPNIIITENKDRVIISISWPEVIQILYSSYN